MIDKLYHASQQGVKIQMIVRGVCCLIPGVKGLSENIEVISIIDRFLEHPRVMIFENDTNSNVYISSADLMTRNMSERVEVGCPIYDLDIKKQIIDTFTIAWIDNVKARFINNKIKQNTIKKRDDSSFRSQRETYNYFKLLVVDNEN